MKPEDNIIKQIKEQEIDFLILYSSEAKTENKELNDTILKWEKKFIGNRTAPDLDQYLWHIFSYGSTNCIEGEKATKKLENQYVADILIFNEAKDYLIKCSEGIPIINIENYTDDVYISHHNMKWTYVIPHEIPYIGPFFSTGHN